MLTMVDQRDTLCSPHQERAYRECIDINVEPININVEHLNIHSRGVGEKCNSLNLHQSPHWGFDEGNQGKWQCSE